MTDINDWPSHPDADPDCECCLGDGLQADGETPCPCIDARKANIAALTIPPAPQPEGEPVTLTYTNWRGETAQRTITPKRIWWGATDWHPEPQWLLTAFDAEKQADRDFAIKDFGAATPPAAQVTVADAIAALKAMPTRTEALGGQDFKYIQLGEALDTRRALAGDGEISRLKESRAKADAVARLVEAARAEADKAMRKFPQPNYVISKVAEEAGEVVKAAILAAMEKLK